MGRCCVFHRRTPAAASRRGVSTPREGWRVMRPEHHQAASLKVRIPRGNAGFWQIIRGLHASQGAFTVADIDGESNVDPHDIKGYVLALARAGFLEVVSRSGKGGATVYRLVRNQNEAPRVRRDGSLVLPTAAEQLWTAIRS